MSKRRAWMIGYDITSPKRLRRVHRFLSARAYWVQLSLFVAGWTEAEFALHWRGLAKLINPRQDDVRAWPIPENPWITSIGQGLPEGVVAGILRPRAVGEVLARTSSKPARKVSSERGENLANPSHNAL